MVKKIWAVIGLCSRERVSRADSGEDRSLSPHDLQQRPGASSNTSGRSSLPAGQQRVEFPGVSAQIIPRNREFRRVECRSHRTELRLRPPDARASSWRKPSAARCASCARTRPPAPRPARLAEVLSTTEGTVLRIGTRIEVLRDDNLPARVIFDKVPDNLRARPTLSVLLNAAQPIDQDVHARVPVARTVMERGLRRGVRRERRAARRCRAGSRWRNNSGTSFANARAQLVAGDLQRHECERAVAIAAAAPRTHATQRGTETGKPPAARPTTTSIPSNNSRRSPTARRSR